MKKILALVAVSAIALSGCVSLAPDYERPDAPVPVALPVGDVDGSVAIIGADWRSVFTDPALQQVIETALVNNRDLRVATLNVQAARARYGITGAARYPTISASASATEREVFDEGGSAQDPSVAFQQVDQASAQLATTAYELDLFGRVNSLNRQALQQYFAAEENRRNAELTLIGTVANAWISLATNERLLALAIDTADAQEESLALTQQLFEAGAANELDYRRALGSVETSRADIARYEALVAQARNALILLTGAPVPETVMDEAELLPAPVSTDLAITRSSDVLLTRPDVLAAERTLEAANANIGAARAAFFPRITLTGSAGYTSTELDGLFTDGTGVWSFTPSVSVPIFSGGANRANLRLAKTQRDIALAQYEQAIQSAFRETADALAVSQTIDRRIASLENFVNANERALELSELRLREGIDSYLSVLDAQRTVYQARQALIAAQQERASNAVALYLALGGAGAPEQG
ncbi:efflux transporter outer membrane subunit [Parvularcula flava]|uniref:Efflux transporter outer membrane subunit n=1 Tax=Aquisalinus luteolus TaxID=1566827 RepID=A0A8J3ETD2_9PROT|nr:efflux transporter outer membrane subunit [Aquisalinus luteolus]NHK26832.1 efflux transporter outer membrane subunit [Aquisalinus luteolus]GGH93547.1 multidrug transporter [Aquisalinus luteolus]